MKLPDSLSRKAVKGNFTNVSEATWDYLFDYEKKNGLFEIRVRLGAMKRPYYDTKKLKKWLLNKGYYREIEFSEPTRYVPRLLAPPSVVHRLV
mgnify:CR=1 FL=1